MNHASYTRDIHAAVQLFEAGHLEEAARAWRALASDPELPLPDQVVQLQNLALAFTRLGRIVEAEAAYDEGIAIEQRLSAGIPARSEGGLAGRGGRSGDAVTIYEWLLGQFWVDSGQIQRYQQNLAALQGAA